MDQDDASHSYKVKRIDALITVRHPETGYEQAKGSKVHYRPVYLVKNHSLGRFPIIDLTVSEA